MRALDKAGHKLPFFPEPVSIEVSGRQALGPGMVPLRAGSIGFWVQATGPGAVLVLVLSERPGPQTLELSAG